MDASELLNAGLEYSEQFAKYQHLLDGIRGLTDTPEKLPKSLQFFESPPNTLLLTFVGRIFEIYHETDLPKTALWSKIMIAQDLRNAKGDRIVKGFLRIDRAGNIKPDAAMSSSHTHESAAEVLLMLLEIGNS